VVAISLGQLLQPLYGETQLLAWPSTTRLGSSHSRTTVRVGTMSSPLSMAASTDENGGGSR